MKMFGLGNDFIVLDARKDPSVCIPKQCQVAARILASVRVVFIIRVFALILLTRCSPRLLARLTDFDGVRAEACDCAD